jgi:hypothetical protein
MLTPEEVFEFLRTGLQDKFDAHWTKAIAAGLDASSKITRDWSAEERTDWNEKRKELAMWAYLGGWYDSITDEPMRADIIHGLNLTDPGD